MKKLILLVFAIALSGCSSSLTSLDPDTISRMDTANSAAESACWKAQTAASLIDCKGLSEMGCLMLKQQQATTQIVAAATGHSPCASKKGLADVLIAEVQAKNETARSVTGNIIDLGKWGVGAWAATDIAKSAFGAAGDHTVVSNSDDAYVDSSKTHTTTTTTTTSGDQTATATGDGYTSQTPTAVAP
jgi:hypothetical protein